MLVIGGMNHIRKAVRMSNKYLDIAIEKVIKQEVNAVLEQIRKEMNDLEKKTIEDVCLDECRPCVYTTFEYVRQVINKYK